MKRETIDFIRRTIAGFGNDFVKDILIEEIQFLHENGPNLWSLALCGNKIRLHFGPFIVFAVEKDKIWLALERSLYLQNRAKLELNPLWKRDEDDFPEYKKNGMLSQNGYLGNGNALGKGGWDEFKKYHFAFIREVSVKAKKLDFRTISNHDVELNIYLKLSISDSIPFPAYISQLAEDDGSGHLPVVPLEKRLIPPGTTKAISSVTVRIGQAFFRKSLLKRSNVCALCQMENIQLLRASHIKPWCVASDEERLDSANGLLLCANHDAAFDSGLISFDPLGKICISSSISAADLPKLNISNTTVILDLEQQEYMIWHRENIFRK